MRGTEDELRPPIATRPTKITPDLRSRRSLNKNTEDRASAGGQLRGIGAA
jgi:hypothetical protein